MRPDLLHAAGIAEAKVLIIAIDDRHKITELAKYAIDNYPNLHVIARATTRHHVYELWAVGCRDIIRETYDSSLRMGRSAYEALGISRETAQAMADAFDRTDRRSMVHMADLYDPDIPPSENQAYVDAVREIRSEWTLELGREMDEIRAKEVPSAGE